MREWTVVGAWLVAVVAAIALGGPVPDNDETNWMPASAQSTQAVRLAQREFPGQDTAALVVVYERPHGTTAADLAKAERDRESLRRWTDGAVAGLVRSDDGDALMVTAPIASARLESGEVTGIVADAREVVRRDLPEGLTALVTGAAAGRADAIQANGRIDVALTVVTIAVVALILVAVYRSFVQMVIPLICVGCAVVVAQAAVARTGVTVSGSTFVVMIVLVFGLGTDYALLLVARFREELIRSTSGPAGPGDPEGAGGRADPEGAGGPGDPEGAQGSAAALHRSHRTATAMRAAAMRTAVRATAPAIWTSGATMMLASLALLAADMNSTAGLGPVAAVAVGSAMLAMLTLLPALLLIAPPKIGRTRGSVWKRIAEWVTIRPRRAWISAAGVLMALAVAVPWVTVGGVNGADNFVRPPQSVAGQRLLAAHFPAGSIAPILVYARAGQAPAVAERIRQIEGIRRVDTGSVSTDGQWVRLDAIAVDQDPLVQDIRAAVGGTAIVGGPAAERVDRDAAMDRDLLVVGVLVAAVVGMMVGVLLRSAVAALLVLGCTLLSAAAALGASSLLFRALGFAQIDQSVLTLGYLFLVGLGVDYTIFLLARARHDGVAGALAATGGVITSAGLVLAATFLVLTITPVVVNIQLGLLVAVGVLLDTMIVRTVLVPAIAVTIGWPPHRSGSGNPD